MNLALGALTLAGLVAPLGGPGIWQNLGTLALAIPVIVTLWCWWRNQQ
jgi:hypothetical protein